VRLKKKEASMIRGICRKLLWHGRQSPAEASEHHQSHGEAAQ
jgi:tRNA/rRNA methyltransferase